MGHCHRALIAVACAGGMAHADPPLEAHARTDTVVHSHTVDLTVGGTYDAIGWSGVPEFVSHFAIARNVIGARAQLTAAFGVGVGGDRAERYGELDATVSHPVARGVHVGIDLHADADLAVDPDDLPTEREWDSQAVGFAAHRLGEFTLVGSAGLVGEKLRGGEPQSGLIGTLGFATTFR